MTLQEAVNNFKELIDGSILKAGIKGKTSMIRSSRPILNIHEAVKQQLVNNGVNPQLIHPPVGCRSPELKLAGALKQKDQDICIVPNNLEQVTELMEIGLLQGVEDAFGEEFTKRTLTINVRSQISSIQKNFDTLYERTFSEAQNLHERCPEIVLGEVYMIAIPEYNEKVIKDNKVRFNNIRSRMVEKYIKSFKAITDRTDVAKHFYQYEATCLLIVDFSKNIPKIYHSTDELIAEGLLPKDTSIKYEGLEWANFSHKLITVYESRFGKGILS